MASISVPQLNDSDILIARAAEVDKLVNAQFEQQIVQMFCRQEAAQLKRRQPYLDNEEELAAQARLINHGYIARDLTHEPVVAYFPKSLPETVVKESRLGLKSFVQEYTRNKNLKVDHDSRHTNSEHDTLRKQFNGEYGTIHLGTWHASGFEKRTNPVVTADLVGTSKHYGECVNLLTSLAALTTELSVLFCAMNNLAWYRALDLYSLLCQHLPYAEWSSFRCLWEAWSCRAFLFNVKTDGHRDIRDDQIGYAAITAFGSFTGGELVVPELGIRFPLQPGDVVFLKGQLFLHFVTPWEPKGKEGGRFSIVHFNHQSVVDWIDEQGTEFKKKHGDFDGLK